MLGMQLVLAWIHGSLLNRQHQDLVALREDIQVLADSLDPSNQQDGTSDTEIDPARGHRIRVPRYQRVRLIQNPPPPNEEDQARKDLEDSNASAKKAVSEAREVQSKLSIEENIRKADEKAKVESAENTWQKWLLVALGAGVLAVAIRSWLNRRG
jgi:hypothetical protein